MTGDDSLGADALRFEFGKNWAGFLKHLSTARIDAARDSLTQWLGTDVWGETSFLDIGCGSGLFSLAARQLGARVCSLDYDHDAVVCAQSLRKQFFKDDAQWRVEQGSILDPSTVAAIGQHDLVYAWGVLHHTGELWQALGNSIDAVGPHGRLLVAIYNDQGWMSRFWTRVKRAYNGTPKPLRLLFEVPGFVALCGPRLIRDTCAGHPLRAWTEQTTRGMSPWYDLIDWLGGYPFEVAKPEEVIEFCRTRGLVLQKLKTCGGRLGCNEYVFERTATQPTAMN